LRARCSTTTPRGKGIARHVRELEGNSRTSKGLGYNIEWSEINHGQLRKIVDGRRPWLDNKHRRTRLAHGVPARVCRRPGSPGLWVQIGEIRHDCDRFGEPVLLRIVELEDRDWTSQAAGRPERRRMGHQDRARHRPAVVRSAARAGSLAGLTGGSRFGSPSWRLMIEQVLSSGFLQVIATSRLLAVTIWFSAPACWWEVRSFLGLLFSVVFRIRTARICNNNITVEICPCSPCDDALPFYRAALLAAESNHLPW
jgi:hypothetical protein